MNHIELYKSSPALESWNGALFAFCCCEHATPIFRHLMKIMDWEGDAEEMTACIQETKSFIQNEDAPVDQLKKLADRYGEALELLPEGGWEGNRKCLASGCIHEFTNAHIVYFESLKVLAGIPDPYNRDWHLFCGLHVLLGFVELCQADLSKKGSSYILGYPNPGPEILEEGLPWPKLEPAHNELALQRQMVAQLHGASMNIQARSQFIEDHARMGQQFKTLFRSVF